MSSDFIEKFALVFIAFLFGLLAEPIKKAIGREKRRVSYSVKENPVISVTQSLPANAFKEWTLPSAQNISTFEVDIENTGSGLLKDATCLISTAGDSIMSSAEVNTVPQKIVNFKIEQVEKGTDIKIKDLSLAPRQRIVCKFLVSSQEKPQISVTGASLDGLTEWIPVSAVGSLDDHVLAIVKLWIFATFLPELIQAVVGAATMLMLTIFGEAITSAPMIIGSSSSAFTLLGSLVSLYFYLRMIPHIAAISRGVLKLIARGSTA